MKKNFYSLLAAGMLFATSCSQEELVDVTPGEGQQKTFKVELPGVKANYRTNIVGTILTQQQNYEVKINP